MCPQTQRTRSSKDWACHFHFRRLVQGLHRCSKYIIKTREGESKEFELDKGFREGDPCSPAAFNIYHSAVMSYCKKNLKEEDVPTGIDMALMPERDAWMRKRNVRCPPRRQEQVHLDKIMFADDTTRLGRYDNKQTMEKSMIKHMGDWGENNNTDNICRLLFGGRVPPTEERS